MQQTFTIIRRLRDTFIEDGKPVFKEGDKVYPGFGENAETAIENLVTQLGEEEDEEYQAALEEGEDDEMELESLRSIAIDQVEGDFQIYVGVHDARPAIDPIDTTWSG